MLTICQRTIVVRCFSVMVGDALLQCIGYLLKCMALYDRGIPVFVFSQETKRLNTVENWRNSLKETEAR